MSLDRNLLVIIIAGLGLELLVGALIDEHDWRILLRQQSIEKVVLFL